MLVESGRGLTIGQWFKGGRGLSIGQCFKGGRGNLWPSLLSLSLPPISLHWHYLLLCSLGTNWSMNMGTSWYIYRPNAEPIKDNDRIPRPNTFARLVLCCSARLAFLMRSRSPLLSFSSTLLSRDPVFMRPVVLSFADILSSFFCTRGKNEVLEHILRQTRQKKRRGRKGNKRQSTKGKAEGKGRREEGGRRREDGRGRGEERGVTL